MGPMLEPVPLTLRLSACAAVEDRKATITTKESLATLASRDLYVFDVTISFS
jgi:hypothetical protein